MMAERTNSTYPLPQSLLSAKTDLAASQTGVVENALYQALPLPDIVFGGGVLVLVIMFHAFWMRMITVAVLKRSMVIRSRASMWQADLGFALTVMGLLALHLSEVFLWSAALILEDIVGDWARAAYFAANCYTALGEPFSLPHTWRLIPPIIAISGIFTFAWTASVLVDFVSRYNTLRADILEQHKESRTSRKRTE